MLASTSGPLIVGQFPDLKFSKLCIKRANKMQRGKYDKNISALGGNFNFCAKAKGRIRGIQVTILQPKIKIKIFKLSIMSHRPY